MTSVNAFATLLEAFFNIFLRTRTHTHTHTYEGIALPLLRMRSRFLTFDRAFMLCIPRRHKMTYNILYM